MTKRALEFFLILALIACAIAFLRNPDTQPAPEPSASVSAPTPSASPVDPPLIVLEPPKPDQDAAILDLEQAEGLEGDLETKTLEIPSPTKQMMTQGAKLYQQNCTLCHGTSGRGDGDAGAVLDPPPTDLTSSNSYKYGRLELGIFRSTLHGVDHTGMAPWDGILTEEEIWAVTFHVRALQN